MTRTPEQQATYDARVAMYAKTESNGEAGLPRGYEAARFVETEGHGAITIYHVRTRNLTLRLNVEPEGSFRLPSNLLAIPTAFLDAMPANVAAPAVPAKVVAPAPPLTLEVAKLVSMYGTSERAWEAEDTAACFNLRAAGF